VGVPEHVLHGMLDTFEHELTQLVTECSKGKVGAPVAAPILDPSPASDQCLTHRWLSSPTTCCERCPFSGSTLPFRYNVWRRNRARHAHLGHPPRGIGGPRGGAARFSSACFGDRTAVVLVDTQTADDLIGQGHGPRGKPRKCWLYAYMGGGLPRQSEEVTGLPLRSRRIRVTATTTTAVWLIRGCRTGAERTDFYEDSTRFAAAAPCSHALDTRSPPWISCCLKPSVPWSQALGTPSGGDARPRRIGCHQGPTGGGNAPRRSGEG
jgi:hypothetical protein